jgi:hypothetical protein
LWNRVWVAAKGSAALRLLVDRDYRNCGEGGILKTPLWNQTVSGKFLKTEPDSVTGEKGGYAV